MAINSYETIEDAKKENSAALRIVTPADVPAKKGYDIYKVGFGGERGSGAKYIYIAKESPKADTGDAEKLG